MARTWARAKRWFWSIMRVRPASRAAATMASQSSMVVAMGFSHSTCLPARRAAIVASACVALEVHTLTASTSGSASSSSMVAYARAPCAAASSRARSRLKS